VEEKCRHYCSSALWCSITST